MHYEIFNGNLLLIVVNHHRQSNRYLANLLLVKLDRKEWCFEWLYKTAVHEDENVQFLAVEALQLLLQEGFYHVFFYVLFFKIFSVELPSFR